MARCKSQSIGLKVCDILKFFEYTNAVPFRKCRDFIFMRMAGMMNLMVADYEYFGGYAWRWLKG